MTGYKTGDEIVFRASIEEVRRDGDRDIGQKGMKAQDSALFLAHGKTIIDILARITNDRQI